MNDYCFHFGLSNIGDLINCYRVTGHNLLATYRLQAQLMVDKFRFGYVFEMPVGSSNLNFTTHEITVGLAMHVLDFHDRALKTY